MKRRIVIVILVLCCAVKVSAQHLQRVVGYVTSESDTVPVKASELTFDKQGRVLADLDFIDESGQTYIYHSNGALAAHTDWYRDHKETCTYEYGRHTRLMTCKAQNENGTSAETRLDSLNENGQVIASFYDHRFYNGKDTIARKSIERYLYNDKGLETYSISAHENGIIYACTKTSYSESGRVSGIVQYNDSLCSRANDSTVYIYDELNRLVSVKRFNMRRYDDTFVFHDEMTIRYGDIDSNETANSLNDSIVTEYLSQWFYDFPALPDHNPLSVDLTRIATHEPGGEFEVDHGFYYSYDESGRLTGMNGHGKVPHNDNVDFNLDITYYEENMAVLELCGENYAGARVCGYTRTYEGKRMSSWSYNSEWGFPFRTTRYIYTYYD